MQTGEMIETWKRWEGQLINGQLLLGEYLGGSGLSAVFVTEIGGAQRNKAVKEQLKISCDGVVAAGERGAPAQTTVYDAPEISMGSVSPASDVWSLSVTMVEALSQRAPVGREKLFLPNIVPPHFADIARHCLVRDPQSRWTLQVIAAQLQSSRETRGATTADEFVAGDAQTSKSSRRYVLPVIAVVVLLVGMLACTRL